MSASPFEPARLAALHDTMAAHVDAGRISGAVVLLAHRDEVHVDTVGARTLGGAPMRDDTIMRISSMTKPIVAIAALALVDEGLVSLDDPVDPWLPELASPTVLAHEHAALDDVVPAVRAVTVRDLLTFRLGHGIVMAPPGDSPIGDAYVALDLGQGAPAPDVPPPTDEWLRRLGSLPLQHQPGAAWRYHTGADVLGALIERVTGSTLDVALRERVFAPLGMPDTDFVVPPAALDRFATLYAPDESTGALTVVDDPRTGQWSRRPAFCSGGAGLVSTTRDFHRIAALLAGGGALDGVRVLRADTVAAMCRNHLDALTCDADYPRVFLDGRGWGLGVAVTVDPHAAPTDAYGAAGTYGWDGGLGSVWRTDPTRDLMVIVLTQTAWTSPAGAEACADAWRLGAAALR